MSRDPVTRGLVRLWFFFWILALFALIFFPGKARAIEGDKQKHIAVSTVLGAGTGSLAIMEDGMTVKSGSFAFCAGMLPGLFKEFADRDTTGWDNADIAANAVGVALGMAIVKTGYVLYFSTSEIKIAGKF